MTCFSFFCGRWIKSSQDPQHSRGDDEGRLLIKFVCLSVSVFIHGQISMYPGRKSLTCFDWVITCHVHEMKLFFCFTSLFSCHYEGSYCFISEKNLEAFRMLDVTPTRN